MNVLVTGANGFIGNKLILTLSAGSSFSLFSVSRSLVSGFTNNCIVGDIDAYTDWIDIIKNQQVVIHTAARAHILKDEVVDPLAEYRRINVDGTLNLARQAAEAGVKRFIFISSIKVNGEETSPGHPFSADDIPAPEDAYGISKFEAEKGLHQLASETDMELVIIRPPLVYGPGVKGNFAIMSKLVSKSLPLPLGAINNKRTFIALDNLVDLIVTCIDHPAAANNVFLAGDGDDLSTTELLSSVARSIGVPLRLLSVPSFLLRLAAMLLGKKAVARRLLGSLQVDISKTRRLLDWEPPISVEEGLRRCFCQKLI